MNTITAKLAGFIAADGHAGRITILDVKGSAPRDIGTMMAVRADGRFTGTIGGGALEWQALSEMQRLLAKSSGAARVKRSFALGPELGQCCGGRVTLCFEVVTAESLLADEGQAKTAKSAPSDTATPVLLYGAGHVGRALVLTLAPLPFVVSWIDPRPDAFPAAMPANVIPSQPSNLLAPVQTASAGSLLLAISHSHALDLAIADAGLRQLNVAFIGVIGSETKRARFLSQLRQAGHNDQVLARLTCPIGDRSIRSKEPAVIAASVAVQLLKEREKWIASANSMASYILPDNNHVKMRSI